MSFDLHRGGCSGDSEVKLCVELSQWMSQNDTKLHLLRILGHAKLLGPFLYYCTAEISVQVFLESGLGTVQAVVYLTKQLLYQPAVVRNTHA